MIGASVTSLILDKRETKIRSMFNNIAPSYDLLNHLLSLNIDHYWRWRTTKLVPPVCGGLALRVLWTRGASPPPNAPILDLCTGTGDLALAYDRAAHGSVPIVGADFCHEMLVRAEAKARRKKADERIRFLEADAQHLPFPSDVFQIATVSPSGCVM